MYTGNPAVSPASLASEVPDDVFSDVLKQISVFVRTKVMPRELEIMATDAIPADLRAQAAEMGLFGYAIPQEWGGLGLDLVQDAEVAMELGYTSLALRSMFGTNNGIAGQVLVGFGTDEQKARWLPGIASGDVVASFALTEPGAGSNPAGLKTTAKPDGDGWIINGTKQFITNATEAGLFVVFARTAPASETSTGIAVFLVPADAPGIGVGTKDAKMGQEGSRTADVTFSDVRVGSEALVGGDGDIGYRAAMTSLARGRIHMAALAVGSAQRALDESVAYAATATQGGTPIGNFQLVQAMIADQQTGVLAGRALAREAARLYVTGEDRRIAPSAAKLFCTEMAGKTADLAVQVHGGSGYMREVAVERIYRDVRLMRLYEGTSEIQRLIIGGGLVRQAQRSAVMTLPLEGMTVVAIEQAVAAPLATRNLADLGARVIKVERIDGGDLAREYDHVVHGTGAHFVWLNRGKESLAVDLKSEQGRDIVRRLIDRADVFLQNLAPGAAERLGFGADELRSTRDELIVVNMSGFGRGGPLEQRKAYDMLIQAEAGLVSITGTAG